MTLMRILFMILSLTLALTGQSNQDPFQWLENLHSPESLEWVNQENKKTLDYFSRHPIYQDNVKQLETLYYSKDQIIEPTLHQDTIYNVYYDKDHPQGVWRRTSLTSYRTSNPEWENLLDLDALGKKEKIKWVWRGSSAYSSSEHPDGEESRALIKIARDGSDVTSVREFDLDKKDFVKDGFVLPETRNVEAWEDLETLLVATTVGPASLAQSGFPRQIRRWRRGTSLEDAPVVFEVNPKSVKVHIHQAGGHTLFLDVKDFSHLDVYLFNPDGTLTSIPTPKEAVIRNSNETHLFLLVIQPYSLNGRLIPEGSILGIPFDAPNKPELVFLSSEKHSVPDLFFTQHEIFVSILEDVQSVIYRLSRQDNGRWDSQKLPLPSGTISILSASPSEDQFILAMTSFLNPPKIYLLKESFGSMPNETLEDTALLGQGKQWMNSEDYESEQRFATSPDGTQIPYFVIQKKATSQVPRPTVLYAYGGFMISKTPFYMGSHSKLWLDRGGVYALANIRGGGEHGPKWHQAALRTKRQNSFDDFIAVAEDLIETKTTTREQLGIMGASNGGLLVAAVSMQRPDLFKAVACDMPLLDMLRFTELSVGSIWTNEYGDPKDPLERAALSAYSPYHNIPSDKKLPNIFFTTSTADDRVHPAHARKMAARMRELAHPIFFLEERDGGHSFGANQEQVIRARALTWTYFYDQLGLSGN